ncbi:MAG: hypothetical protein JNG88_04675 [Phycisphaerales bacterium]|nr:hypothetical protein [Phycisphaerales bacterium]
MWDGIAVLGLGAGLLPQVYSLFGDNVADSSRVLLGTDSTLFVWNGQDFQWDGIAPGRDVYAITSMERDDARHIVIGTNGVFRQSESVCVWSNDGASWSPLGVFGGGFNGPVVYSLLEHDDGSGLALYAGGDFSWVDDVSAESIARHRDGVWEAVGGGLFGRVRAMHVYNDGSGPALFVGGRFAFPPGGPLRGVLKWDGQTWTSTQTGFDLLGQVRAIAEFDGSLYVGGEFISIDGMSMRNLARWDGHIWHEIAPGARVNGTNGPVYALEVFDDGDGPALYVGGEFSVAGNAAAQNIARWDGAEFSAIGRGHGASYFSLAVFSIDTGNGPELYAVADPAQSIGDEPSFGILRWTGHDWISLGELPPDRYGIYAAASFDDGSGRKLYVTGDFMSIDGVPARGFARYDGQRWEEVGGGIELDTLVFILKEFDDGGGPALYAAGQFTSIGGVAANTIAKWNGVTWSPLGAGLGGISGPRGYDLAVYDDGAGPALYVSGYFGTAGGITARSIARWDGQFWSALEPGLWSPPMAYSGYCLETFDDGTGEKLYVGGFFYNIGPLIVHGLAAWDGASWSALGDGPGLSRVADLAAVDFGYGSRLFAGGDRGVPPDNRTLAIWDGENWMGFTRDTGPNQQVFTLAAGRDQSGPTILVAGAFDMVGGIPSAYIARFGCVRNDIAGDLNCDQTVNTFDIDAFVLALQDAARYAEVYPYCRVENADTNADNVINNFDIDPFVALLVGE